jgi:predicted metal-binding membrane protein
VAGLCWALLIVLFPVDAVELVHLAFFTDHPLS